MKKTMEVPHGILFILDNEDQGVIIPEYVNGTSTNANSSCVSVIARAPVDGETEIFLNEMISQNDLEKFIQVFDGTISCSSKNISIATSDGVVFQTVVDKENPNIAIWLDHEQWPSRVVIQCS